MCHPCELEEGDRMDVSYSLTPVDHVYMPYAMASWGDGYHPEYFDFPPDPAAESPNSALSVEYETKSSQEQNVTEHSNVQ